MVRRVGKKDGKEEEENWIFFFRLVGTYVPIQKPSRLTIHFPTQPNPFHFVYDSFHFHWLIHIIIIHIAASPAEWSVKFSLFLWFKVFQFYIFVCMCFLYFFLFFCKTKNISLSLRFDSPPFTDIRQSANVNMRNGGMAERKNIRIYTIFWRMYWIVGCCCPFVFHITDITFHVECSTKAKIWAEFLLVVYSKERAIENCHDFKYIESEEESHHTTRYWIFFFIKMIRSQ